MKLGKSVIAILLSSFIGVAMSPEILTAVDMPRFSDIDTSRAVETVLPAKTEVKKISVPETASAVNVSSSVAISAPVVLEQPIVMTPVYENVIKIDGRKIALSKTSSLEENAGTEAKAWLYGEKFIYAHNLDHVFGGLENLEIGDGFAVEYGGETRNFEIRDIKVYDKTGEILTLDGGGNYMQYVKLGKSSKSVAYDMALMTCHGENDSQRLVVFAEEV